jgi:glycosyltransferase involved in cell wall biosynthesis/Tfp pilus assembly protein PilF
MKTDSVKSSRYLISAIVSTYNAERFIHGCLVDLEAQTIADKLEIIVVDTGSGQNEHAVVEEFQKSYSNIRYIRVENRETVYQAWNRGLRAAHGKYITNANTDDRHKRDALEKLVDILEKRPDMVLAYGDCFITRVENEQFEKFTPAGKYNWPDFSRNSLLNACIVGPQPVWRRSLHNEFGYFDENYRCGADYEFWLRISERYNFIHIREYLGLFYENKNTVSMKGNLPKKEMEEIKETYRKRYDRVPILKSGEEGIYRILHDLNMDKTEVNVLVNTKISDTLLEDILKLPSVILCRKGQRSSTNTWDAILISADEVEGYDFAELMSNLDFRYIGITEAAYRLSDKKCTDFLNDLSEFGCHDLFGDCSVFEWSERATFGRILFEQGKLLEAARYLRRILNADPADVNGLNTMGLIAFKQNFFDRAEEFTLKALQLDRRNVNTLVNLSEICLAKGQYQRARKFAERAIEIDGRQQPVLERKLGIKLGKSTVAEEYRNSRHLSPKRILVINNLYPPQELGGYGRLMCDFANILEKRGHTIQVLTSDTPYLGQIEKDESNIDRQLLLYGGWMDGVCKQIDDNDRVIQTIKTNLEKVRSIIRGFRPELCLLGNIDFLSPIVLTPLLEMNIPVVHHLGNKMPGYNVNDTPQSDLYRLATASKWLRDEVIRQRYPLKDISIIYPGALVEEFRMHVLPARDRLRIAYAGIVLPYKGPHILIEALKMLHDRGVDFCCALAGTTTDMKFVDRLKTYVAASGMQEKVDFLGFLPRAKLKTFFARNNVLVFPSIVQEAFGISQVEAMAAGLTVISSGTGGAKEIIDHGKSGLIFESNNSESLARELLGLVENPGKWQSIAEGAEKRAIAEFDIERSVDILEQEFSMLINSQRSADSEYKQAKTVAKVMENNGRSEIQKHGVLWKTPEAFYEEVHKLMNNGSIKETIGALGMVLAVYPDYARVHNDLGVLYYGEGEKEKALGHFEEAARLEPQNSVFQKNLANFYFVEQGRVEESMELYDKVLGLNPKDIDTLLILGHICVSLGQFNDADVYYNRILKLEPWNMDARERLDLLMKKQMSEVGGRVSEIKYQSTPRLNTLKD